LKEISIKRKHVENNKNFILREFADTRNIRTTVRNSSRIRLLVRTSHVLGKACYVHSWSNSLHRASSSCCSYHNRYT